MVKIELDDVEIKLSSEAEKLITRLGNGAPKKSEIHRDFSDSIIIQFFERGIVGYLPHTDGSHYELKGKGRGIYNALQSLKEIKPFNISIT